MKHTICTNSGGRVVVLPSSDRSSLVLGINVTPGGAASVRLDAAQLGALLFALECGAEECGFESQAVAA